MIARLQALAVVTFVVTLSAGCGGDDDSSETPSAVAPPAGAPRAEASTQDWSERLEDEPVTTVLAALGRPHAEVRDAVGPHRLRYESAYSLQPQPAEDELPPVDGTVLEAFDIHDELTLLWLPDDSDGPRFALTQHNDAERGRDVSALDGKLYTKLEHRPWQVGPIESEVHELWLDDAWRGPGDVLQLAAPWLSLRGSPKPGAGLAGGDAIAFSASMAERGDESLATDDWRGSATFDEISGEVVLDAQTGVWLSADLTVRYAVPAAGGRRARGVVTLRGTLEPAPKDAPISVPGDAKPVFERARYDVERARLLDGLAAP